MDCNKRPARVALALLVAALAACDPARTATVRYTPAPSDATALTDALAIVARIALREGMRENVPPRPECMRSWIVSHTDNQRQRTLSLCADLKDRTLEVRVHEAFTRQFSARAERLRQQLADSLKHRREVAVTFDDLPGVHLGGGCDAKTLHQLNRKLIAGITRHQIPAIGLVVEGKCDGNARLLADLLRLWRDAGLELGNHSYSHFDINNTPLERYQADVVRGETTTRVVLAEEGRRLEYFRHPFLHAGKDLATKKAFEEFLEQRGYRVAPVTIDNQEWVFAEVYARAKKRGDQAAMQRIGSGYVIYMEEIFGFFERLSVEVLGYEVKQILLLHDNPLNADYLDELVEMMKQRGYRFISLEHALTDPAYQLADTYAGPVGLSWIHRWSLTKGRALKEEPREPDWIRQLFEQRTAR